MSHNIYVSRFISFCHQRGMYVTDILFVHSAANYRHIRCILSETHFHTKFLFCTWNGAIVTPHSEVSMVVILVILITEITREQIWVTSIGTMPMARLVNSLWLLWLLYIYTSVFIIQKFYILSTQVVVGFVWFWKQTGIFSLHGINWLDFITVMKLFTVLQELKIYVWFRLILG
jgi:hypothetical protein